MPRFVLKFKMRGRPNRDRPDRTLEREEVVLGSRPLADVYVPDRLVPQEALALRFDGTHLSVDVRGRLAGAFVDGHPLEGHGQLKHGATVQIGHALVECAIDAAKGECTLTTNEQYLQAVVDGIVTKTKPAKPFALVDSGPQEQRWGKSAVLTRANWAAASVGVAILAAFWFGKDTDAMSRGELFHAHKIGAPGGPKDCAACHAPLASTYDGKCVACHKGFDAQATHPYGKAGSLGCNECHAEHVGADADIVPSMKTSASGWPTTCLRCHAGQPYPAADVPAAVVDAARPHIADARGAPFARQLLVDGFSHRDHRVAKAGLSSAPGRPPKKGEAPLACGECHKLLAPGAKNDAIPTAEFAGVKYEKCLECHADWRVAVHGRDEDGAACYACHAKAESPSKITSQLKSVELPATESKWVLKPRGHDFQKDECLRCHVLSKSQANHADKQTIATFRHDHHLRTVAPPAGGEFALSQDCRPCHDAVAGSSSLAGAALVNTTGCGKCHVDSVPTQVPVKEGAVRRVVDMVHKIHVADAANLPRRALLSAPKDTLARGCLSCHKPVAGAAPMTFETGATDCKACHTAHENVGEGRCAVCHVDRTPGKNREVDGRVEYRFNEPGIFEKSKATTKTTAAMALFDHRSRGHAGRECAECHRAENVDQATRVLDVTWPAFDEDACVKCHVRERFHR